MKLQILLALIAVFALYAPTATADKAIFAGG
jgi:hypothetical protein